MPKGRDEETARLQKTHADQVSELERAHAEELARERRAHVDEMARQQQVHASEMDERVRQAVLARIALAHREGQALPISLEILQAHGQQLAFLQQLMGTVGAATQSLDRGNSL